MDNEENELGVRCVAAAIPDWHGAASYALSISAPVSRMTDERVQSLIPALLETPGRDLRLSGGTAGMTGGAPLDRVCEDVQKGTLFPCGAAENPL